MFLYELEPIGDCLTLVGLRQIYYLLSSLILHRYSCYPNQCRYKCLLAIHCEVVQSKYCRLGRVGRMALRVFLFSIFRERIDNYDQEEYPSPTFLVSTDQYSHGIWHCDSREFVVILCDIDWARRDRTWSEIKLFSFYSKKRRISQSNSSRFRFIFEFVVSSALLHSRMIPIFLFDFR